MNFIKKLILATFLIFQNFLYAQNTNFENSLLWQISGNGLTQPSYIFGTVHLIEKNDFFIDDVVLNKLKSSQTLVLETDIDLTLSQQLELMNQMKLPSGKTIANYMSVYDFEIFKKYCIDTVKMSQSRFDMLTGFKPFMLLSYIEAQKIKKPVSYEKYLYKKSKKYKIHIDKLETVEEQLSFFDFLTIEEQCLYFFNTSSEKENNLFEFYKQQNINKLQEMAMDTSYLEFSEILLKKRNEKWIPKIELFIKAKSTFIAVGAAHLGGQYGVLNLLKEKGYNVEPIFFNSTKK